MNLNQDGGILHKRKIIEIATNHKRKTCNNITLNLKFKKSLCVATENEACNNILQNPNRFSMNFTHLPTNKRIRIVQLGKTNDLKGIID